MARNKLHFGSKKKNRLLITCAIVTGVCVISASALAAGHLYMHTQIKSNETNIEEIKASTAAVEQEIEVVKSQEATYHEQLDKLNQELSRYEPVVIPDSMKANEK